MEELIKISNQYEGQNSTVYLCHAMDYIKVLKEGSISFGRTMSMDDKKIRTKS